MECMYFGVHPTLSTWGGVGDNQVLRFALLLSLFLIPSSLCAQLPAAPVQRPPVPLQHVV